MRAESRETLLDHGMNAVLRTPYKFLVTASLHGLALGALLGSAVLRAGDAGTVLLNALSFIAAAVLLLLTALFVKMDFNHLIYQVGFSIMATGALLIAPAPAAPAPGEFVQFVGFCYVHLIMWGLCSYLTKSFALPAPWVVAWPTCCLMAGQLIGGGAAATLVQQPDALAWTTTLASLARGRNRRYISEKLVVSEETVKSHVSSIYAKLGVHTQQELLDVVEVSVATLRDGAGPTPFA